MAIREHAAGALASLAASQHNNRSDAEVAGAAATVEARLWRLDAWGGMAARAAREPQYLLDSAAVLVASQAGLARRVGRKDRAVYKSAAICSKSRSRE